MFLRGIPSCKTRRPALANLRLPYLNHLICRFAVGAALLHVAALSISAAQAQGPTAGASPAPFAGALVAEWTGEVQVQLPGMSIARPVRGQILPAGTLLDTGNGRLMLVLRTDESQIVVYPHTRLVVKEPAVGNWDSLAMLFGRIRAFIQKRTGGEPAFQMGTPSAVIAVRGTRFDVEVNSRGVSEIDVFEGLVEVAALGVPGTSVLVAPGFSTRVAMGTPPEPPVRTSDIRPDVEPSNELARAEFVRGMVSNPTHDLENTSSELNELELDVEVGESRKTKKP